ncbi:MAG: glycosyltransferase [Candidatus Gastranaerophilaceae bacterium]|jgi:predicted glycosyltransferase
MKRILFYTANGVGLGHLRRSSLIAESIIDIDSNTKIFFISLCSDSRFLTEFGLPFLKLKPISDDIIKNNSVFSYCKKSNERKIKKVLNCFKPDTVVIDMHVFSNYSFPSTLLNDEYDRIKKVLIYRMTGKKDFTDNFKIYYDKFKIFDTIIVPHSRDECEYLINKRNFNKIVENRRIIFTGPIYREINKNALEDCKKKYRVNKKDFLLTVTLGGGGKLILGNCESPSIIIYELIKNSLLLKKNIKRLKIILVTGPFFKDDKILASLLNCFSGIIRIKKFEKNLLELYRLSNLVICPIGYNTGNEIIEAKTPAIVFPLQRGGKKSNEQFERARYLKSFGVIKIFDQKKELKTIFFDVINNLDKMKKSFSGYKKAIKGNKTAAKIILK